MSLGVFSHTAVMSPGLKVYVNGILREHISATWSIDTSGGLPETLISTGTGIKSRTGRIVFAPSKAVRSSGVNPVETLGAWRPHTGDKIRVVASIGGVDYPRFTGRIGKVSASFFYDGAITAEITDRLGDMLDKLITIEPRITTPNGYGRSSWVIQDAITRIGMGAIPPPSDGSVVNATYQSGTAPAIGVLADPSAVDVPLQSDKPFGLSSDPYGLMAGTKITVLPDPNKSRGTYFVSIFGRASTQWDSSVIVHFVNGTWVKLKHEIATHTLRLFTSTNGEVWAGSWSGDTPLPYLAMMVTDTAIQVWTSPNASKIVYYTSIFAKSDVKLTYGEYLIGVDVSYIPIAEFVKNVNSVTDRPASWTLTELATENISAARGFQNTLVRDIVDAWLEATLSVVWVDEEGTPHFSARDRLINGSPVRGIEIEKKVFDGEWALSRDGMRSRVVLKGIRNNVRGYPNTVPRTVVYQPSNLSELDYGIDNEEFINIPDDEDWIGVDTDWEPVADLKRGIDNTERFNNERSGSWWSITWQHADSPHLQNWTASEDLSATIERLGQRAFKTNHRITGTRGTGSIPKYYATTSTNSGTKLYAAHRGIPMPLIRANNLVKWVDYSVVGIEKLDDPTLPEYLLDVGWWLTPADAQRFANVLAAEIMRDRFTFDRIPVLWDPTRQVGDSETWTYRNPDGEVEWVAGVLVTGYSETWDENGLPTQEVDVQVKKIVDPRVGKTYADRSAAYRLYSDSINTGATYQQVYDALPGKA